MWSPFASIVCKLVPTFEMSFWPEVYSDKIIDAFVWCVTVIWKRNKITRKHRRCSETNSGVSVGLEGQTTIMLFLKMNSSQSRRARNSDYLSLLLLFLETKESTQNRLWDVLAADRHDPVWISLPDQRTLGISIGYAGIIMPARKSA